MDRWTASRPPVTRSRACPPEVTYQPSGGRAAAERRSGSRATRKETDMRHRAPKNRRPEAVFASCRLRAIELPYGNFFEDSLNAELDEDILRIALRTPSRNRNRSGKTIYTAYRKPRPLVPRVH
ncbi:ATP-binding cassette sub-family C member 8 [Anopheles sinensis]|uniref:ATP-binding cassette sub-family C member 8 n=1 Tax=Anopheles sinensis TaxID=74873 RepID=A0A084W1E7_ANOSI|nr:ATP-binding cassette sub-family C member 8 [Anopheles sinensis]